MNETTQQEKTTQLSSRNEQLNSATGTKQLNSPVGTKQLNSTPLVHIEDRLTVGSYVTQVVEPVVLPLLHDASSKEFQQDSTSSPYCYTLYNYRVSLNNKCRIGSVAWSSPHAYSLVISIEIEGFITEDPTPSVRHSPVTGVLNYDQKSQMRTSSRIGGHEVFRSASSTTRQPGGIFQNLRNSIQGQC
ncbi:hypothetical protein TNCV_99521 [Trichonephila clavipes]|nr:hypothetical protein TNCV_99521 [Trichonephila clavipes]